MLRTRPKWPNAQECCGREIQTTRLGRKRAWWAQGSVFDKFEQDIQPEIETFLRNADLKDVEIFFRIYMIGKNEETSRPTIMVCCADVSMARRAKESLRESSIIRNNPGFALGSIDRPLEQLVPAQGMASDMDAKNLSQVPEAAFDSDLEVQVFATSPRPAIGRRLFVSHDRATPAYRHSTGGVVVAAHDQFYQLTVGHITDVQDGTQISSSTDLDACSFDGQSDIEDEDESSIFEQNMRRASMSFFDLSGDESWDIETRSSASNTINGGSPACTDYITTNSDATGNFNHGQDEVPESPPLIRVGTIALHCRGGGNPNLDYALVSIQIPQGGPINQITLNSGEDSKYLQVHDVCDVGHEERRVIAVTGSGGMMTGVLIPGTTFVGRANQQQPQKLRVVQLDGVVAEGDSGTPVIDESSGDLYGHMVSGCPGTRVAYIVAATDVFDDLRTQLHGDVSIPSSRKIQKLPMRPLNVKRKTRNPNKPRKRQARSTRCKESSHTGTTSTLHSKETRSGTENGWHQDKGHIISIFESWDPAFFQPKKRLLALHLENQPYIGNLDCLDDDVGDPVFFFMHHVEDPQHRSFKTKDTTAFLSDISLTRFLYQDYQDEKPLALLDERCSDGETSKSRVGRGPLTALQLYRELSKPRFRQVSTEQSELDEEPDADRRVIYISNLDLRSITALVATASMSHIFALRSMIEKHLAQRSSIQTTISAHGLPFFQLDLHLPFFVWIERETPFEDQRRTADGKSLRKVTDVSFLSRAPVDSVTRDYLCEAQLSVMVMGLDNRRWTAYGFIDTYFAPDSSEDAMAFNDEDMIDIKPDPLARGILDHNLPLLDPMDYFLAVLETRMVQLEQEWRDLTNQVELKVERYINDHDSHTFRDRETSLDATDIYWVFQWTTRTMNLLRMLQQNISEMIFQWDEFMKDGIIENDAKLSTFRSRLLRSVKVSFKEMNVIARKLCALEQRCKCFLDNQKLHLLGEPARPPQQKQVKTLFTTSTVMVFYYYPAILAALILSMPSSAMPVTNPTFGSYFALTLILSTIASIAILCLSHQWDQRILTFLSRVFEPKRERTQMATDLESPLVARGWMSLNRFLVWWKKDDAGNRGIELGRYPQTTYGVGV
ncbi:hypothetical protein B0T10DRAFT_585437 [Thelonectria olida]|uniref:Uncharacterized protein n=1 Tax=Thelonectria olida TaxID=1576542 RepID=A0A9P8VU76_9HYPO|nr:hypothetical protein B0T10DRAFT_585437 [Thelonectria olida]